MKRIALSIITLFVCVVCYGATFNQHWYIGDNTPIQTSCTTGGDIILPTPPTKYGYNFIGWEQLPFTRIEYIESTGHQLIDTGYVPNQNIKIITLITPKNIHETGVAGVDWARYSPFLMFYSSMVRWHFTQSGSMDSNYITSDTPVYIEASNGFLRVNSLEYNSSPVSSFSTNDTFKIFYWKASYNSSIKVHYFKIFDNDVLVRDFIPVLDKDGVPCMFDKVEGKFYYNAGTGDFIAGPVIGE